VAPGSTRATTRGEPSAKAKLQSRASFPATLAGPHSAQLHGHLRGKHKVFLLLPIDLLVAVSDGAVISTDLKAKRTATSSRPGGADGSSARQVSPPEQFLRPVQGRLCVVLCRDGQVRVVLQRLSPTARAGHPVRVFFAGANPSSCERNPHVCRALHRCKHCGNDQLEVHVRSVQFLQVLRCERKFGNLQKL